MEEVVRFLERCYQNIETIQKNNKIAQSCSMNRMFVEQSNQPLIKSEHRTSDKGSLRSNLNIASNKMDTNNKEQQNESFTSNSSMSTSNSIDSYKNFSDFTW